jgi:DNA-binding response OmpR family regulator
VHISWLRAALEENPRKPKYLKTVRGVGYRLDTDSN